MKRDFFFSGCFLCLVMTGLLACSSEKISPETLSDAQLFALTKDTLNKTYYQNASILGAAGNSPHGSFRLHFNATATNVLDGTLEIPAGSKFPDGSLIAKEIMSGGAVELYAIMYKYKGTWLWAEYAPDGQTVYSVNLRGAQCINCHKDTPNRDLVRTFDLH